MATSAELEPNTRPLDEIQQEQLQVYAQEIPGLYSLMRSGFAAWLDVEGRLRSKGVNMESLQQVLSAAHTCSQLMLEGAVPASSRKAIASRLHKLVEGALERVQKGAAGPGIHENHDLGLAALLREEIYAKASEHSWHIEVELETMRASAMTETVAWLIVREAVQRAALNPETQRVSLTMKRMGEQLNIILSLYPDGLEPQNGNLKYHRREFLTKLYARVARGSCTWRPVWDSKSGLGSGVEMELKLPLDISEAKEERGEGARTISGAVGSYNKSR